MPAIKIQGFGGMIPATDPRLLPDWAAADSQNVWYYNGTLQGIVEEQSLFTLVNPGVTMSIFRVPIVGLAFRDLANSYWLEFSEVDISVVKSPVAESTEAPIYWASGTAPPGYNTFARIAANDPPLILGIPTPEVAPTVAVVGGSGVSETRAYVYTWLSQFFEEGPPSPPTVVTGFVNGTWNIGMTAPTVGDTTNRLLTYTNIYRTVTASTGVATFFFVAQLPIATLTYADTLPDDIVTAQGQLQSTNYTAPPAGLQGLATLANGMLAGWLDGEIWFCEPYLPHAWPVQYQIAVEYPIVAMVGSGQSLLIGTEGFPYFATGVSPSQMALARIPESEPCVSRGSMVPTQFGALYSSPNGVIFFAATGTIQNVTRDTITKAEWQQLVTLEEIRAGELNGAYFLYDGVQEAAFEPTAFDNDSFQVAGSMSTKSGLLIEIAEGHVGLTRLLADQPFFNVFKDPWTGEILLVGETEVFWVNLTSTTLQEYTWTSKIFVLREPSNLGAAKIQYDPPPDGSDGAGMISTYAWNNGAGPFLWQERAIPASNRVFRLPSGFKADAYQFVVSGNLVIKSIQFGHTVAELQSV